MERVPICEASEFSPLSRWVGNAAFDSAIALWQGAPALDSVSLLMHGPVSIKFLKNFSPRPVGPGDS